MNNEPTTETYRNYTFTTGQSDQKEAPNPFWLHVQSPQARLRNRRFSGQFDTYPTEARRAEAIARVKAQLDDKANRAAAKLEARRKAVAKFVNPYKVGDLLASSWGYDQTNVEFFQVIEAGKRCLKLRRIGADAVPKAGYSPMSGHSRPVKDRFLDEQKYPPVWVTIQISVGYDGKVSHHVPSPIHGNLSKTSETAEHYVSWYA